MSDPLRVVKRLARRTVDTAQHRVGRSVDLLRRGDRIVLNTPPAGMRLGNLLYLWLNVHRRRAAGADVVVRETADMHFWLQEFGGLRGLTVSQEQMRFSDRREWESDWLYQRFGVDFTRDELRRFIHDVFAGRVERESPGGLVINVRRGDFYGTEFEAKHGFQVAAYINAALRCLPPAEKALIVSDDSEWCRENLGAMLRAGVGDVAYAEPDPLQNLLTLAGAQTLIGANSTFSYWGAYLADALHDDARIVMPRFHARMEHGNDAFQLDPDWTALDGFA